MRGLRAVAWVTIAGTALELAMLRHWGTLTRTIPWVVLGVLAVAMWLASTGRRRPALVLAAVVAASSAYGVVEHVLSNLDAAPLDFRYADRWDSMSAAAKLWDATTGAVGPSPTLAPAILALAATLVVLVATASRPAS